MLRCTSVILLSFLISLSVAQDLTFYTVLAGSFYSWTKVHFDGTKIWFYNTCPPTTGIGYTANWLCGDAYWFLAQGTNWIIYWNPTDGQPWGGPNIYKLDTVYNNIGSPYTQFVASGSPSSKVIDWSFCNSGTLWDYVVAGTNPVAPILTGGNVWSLSKYCDPRVNSLDASNGVYLAEDHSGVVGAQNPPMYIWYYPSRTVQKFDFWGGWQEWYGFCENDK